MELPHKSCSVLLKAVIKNAHNRTTNLTNLHAWPPNHTVLIARSKTTNPTNLHAWLPITLFYSHHDPEPYSTDPAYHRASPPGLG